MKLLSRAKKEMQVALTKFVNVFCFDLHKRGFLFAVAAAQAVPVERTDLPVENLQFTDAATLDGSHSPASISHLNSLILVGRKTASDILFAFAAAINSSSRV
ncbi:MAG: hypothetical protein WAW79_08110 [Steroidobacteraceae bacterium]